MTETKEVSFVETNQGFYRSALVETVELIERAVQVRVTADGLIEIFESRTLMSEHVVAPTIRGMDARAARCIARALDRAAERIEADASGSAA